MTYAPPTLIALRDFLWLKTGLSAVALGIVGDAAHAGRASYHNGKDRMLSRLATDYTAQTARDKAGLSNAASAIDIGNFPRLREMSGWLVNRCRSGSNETADIREVIYSPDGLVVLRWDRERGVGSAPRPGEADNSHRTHTHVSWYRDAEARDHSAVFRHFFDGESDDMKVTRNRWERWRAVNGNGVLRRNPVRAEAPFTRLPDGTEVSSFAEVTADGNNWRQVEFSGPAYLLRADFDPVTAGGDPALDAAFAGFVATGTVATDCTAEVQAAVKQAVTVTRSVTWEKARQAAVVGIDAEATKDV
jgi:hypothetical protein